MWFRKKPRPMTAAITDLIRPGLNMVFAPQLALNETVRVVHDNRGIVVQIMQEFPILTPDELSRNEWVTLVFPRLRQIRGGARRMCDGDILGESA